MASHDNYQVEEILEFFADMLSYPSETTMIIAKKCYKTLQQAGKHNIASLLEPMIEFAKHYPLNTLQEGYTSLFDLQPLFPLYIGYHLFGETYDRSRFMVELTEHYKAVNFAVPPHELPDHLTMVLRFLAKHHQSVIAKDLIQEGLLPMLETAAADLKIEDEHQNHTSGQAELPSNPHFVYLSILRALHLVLQDMGHQRTHSSDPGFIRMTA